MPTNGELGSLNPTVVTPAAVASRGADIAVGFVSVLAAKLAGTAGVRRLPPPPSIVEGYRVSPALLAVSAPDLVRRASTLLEECFGPAALVVGYGSVDQLAALNVLPGSLTASVQADVETEPDLAGELPARPPPGCCIHR